MKMVLVIFLLTIQSSYLRNTEAEATTEAFDTVQFLATEKGAWRIKTYATDQDVHVWSIATTVDDVVKLARANTEKHYRDVLSEAYVIESSEGIDGLKRELHARGLGDNLETSDSGMLFWAPAATSYRTKSQPRK